MAITIDLPPQMAEEVRGYTMLEGNTLERFFLSCLAKELERRREAAKAMADLDVLVEKTQGCLSGCPYKFNRADAYEPETSYA